ncbi:A24 family peptidase [Sodalis praecaptivus]|uniref:A24 family peptidase n=1 Tax=Sodalis praecaptivus TaxID=1239307 RepID=UPI00280B1BBA|nr:A24 family peptidase [Sodalis praecaptivus]
MLFNLGATFVPLQDAVCGAVIGYLMLWGVNGGYRLVCRRHGLVAGDFKLLAALGAWLGWRALPPLLLLAATGGLMCVVCVRWWRGADLASPLAFGPWLALAGALLLFWNGG